MLVLISIYKNMWKEVDKNEMEIKVIAFETQEEYLNWLQEKN
jgi:hypothetical protein